MLCSGLRKVFMKELLFSPGLNSFTEVQVERKWPGKGCETVWGSERCR